MGPRIKGEVVMAAAAAAEEAAAAERQRRKEEEEEGRRVRKSRQLFQTVRECRQHVDLGSCQLHYTLTAPYYCNPTDSAFLMQLDSAYHC